MKIEPMRCWTGFRHRLLNTEDRQDLAPNELAVEVSFVGPDGSNTPLGTLIFHDQIEAGLWFQSTAQANQMHRIDPEWMRAEQVATVEEPRCPNCSGTGYVGGLAGYCFCKMGRDLLRDEQRAGSAELPLAGRMAVAANLLEGMGLIPPRSNANPS